MREHQQIQDPAHALPQRGKCRTSHYIPQLVLDGFRLGGNGRQRWLLHDMGAGFDGPQLHRIGDVGEMFRIDEAYFSRGPRFPGDYFAAAVPSRASERRLRANEAKAAETVRKISRDRTSALSALDRGERLHLCRFLSLMCARNPHFHLVYRQLIPDPSYAALMRQPEGPLADSSQILRNCSLAAFLSEVSGSEIDERIDVAFLRRFNREKMNCTIRVLKIDDPGEHFITGSFPACPLQTGPDDKMYMWLPVTKKIALCYYFPDDLAMPSTFRDSTSYPQVAG